MWISSLSSPTPKIEVGARKLPAFVWNQGGLGKASTYWTDFGKRGYAVVCIDFPHARLPLDRRLSHR